jgi:pimeloyl-ACP methyl ester carboxylesterase
MEQTERVYRGWDGIGLRHPETGPLRYSAPSATGRPPCDRSGRAPVEDYAIAHSVADMAAVLDALGEERSHVIGHDWGAVATATSSAMSPISHDRGLSPPA